jgi:hypothetical protein
MRCEGEIMGTTQDNGVSRLREENITYLKFWKEHGIQYVAVYCTHLNKNSCPASGTKKDIFKDTNDVD